MDEKIFCIAEGTPVELASGVAVPIEHVQPGELVHGLDDASKGLQPREVAVNMNRGMRPCVELSFNDGRQLTCTEDHRVRSCAAVCLRCCALDRC